MSLHRYTEEKVAYQNAHTGAAAAQPPDPGILEAIEKSLDAAADRLAQATRHAANLADRLLGSRPEPTGQATGAPPSPPAVQRLVELGERLHSRIAAMEHELERLMKL